MKSKDFGDMVSDFVPAKESLVSTRDVVKYFKRKGFPFALRTLTKYATAGLIPKPLHIGNKGYYEKDYIFSQLEAIYVLKSVFQWSLEQIKKLSDHDRVTLREIVEVLHGLAQWGMREMGTRDGTKTIAAWLANSQNGRKMIEEFLNAVAEGEEPRLAKEEVQRKWVKMT